MVKTMKKVFSILTVLCMMMGILSITAFAAVSTATKVGTSTSDPVIIGGEGSDKNFFVAVKQAGTFSCWTAVDVTGDPAAQGQIEAAVLAVDGKGQAKNAWEFHYFDPSFLGQSFYVFNNHSDGTYSGTAVINYDTTNKVLTFQMADSDKWSHLLYGTYFADPVTPQTGSLTITKAIGTGNEYPDATSDTYSFTITGTDGTAGKTYSLKDSNDAIGSVTFDGETNTASLDNVAVNDTPITITGLPLGDYTITETSAGQEGYTLSTSYNNTAGTSGGVTLTQNSTAATMAIVNTYTAPDPETTGSLTITKAIGDGNAYENARSATYTVSIDGPAATANQTYGLVAFDGNRHAVVLVTVDTDAEITGLPLGDYTITETSAGQEGYTLSTSYNNTAGTSGGVTLTQNSTAATMAIVNTYTVPVTPPVDPGTHSLTITKTIAGNNAPSGQQFTFTVTLGDQQTSYIDSTYQIGSTTNTYSGPFSVSITGEGEIEISGITAGTAYTVVENALSDSQWKLTSSFNTSGKLDDAQTASFTNTYTANGGGGGSETPSNPAPTTPVEITETTTPLGEVPAEPTEPTEEIADEPVALASVPQTGDTSALWFTLSGLSAVGLAGVYVLGRKRRDDSIQ